LEGIPSPGDIDFLMSYRHAQGGDFWTTIDGRTGVGSPFSTLDCGLMLTELGLPSSDPVARGIAEALLRHATEDGRIRPGPKLAVQPCHTANAARLLARLGYADDPRLARTFGHLLTTQSEDGGWRCKVLKFGTGPDTDASNPGVTLAVLDALRFRKTLVTTHAAQLAVEALVEHWRVRRPLGPCRYGIGTRFMRVEYPMFRYNLFFYVYVLSFYPSATDHPAFLEAFDALSSKLEDNQMIVEHCRKGLEPLELCRTGSANPWATQRFREILRNLRR
jgi:hypothetical protein